MIAIPPLPEKQVSGEVYNKPFLRNKKSVKYTEASSLVLENIYVIRLQCTTSMRWSSNRKKIEERGRISVIECLSRTAGAMESAEVRIHIIFRRTGPACTYMEQVYRGIRPVSVPQLSTSPSPIYLNRLP